MTVSRGETSAWVSRTVLLKPGVALQRGYILTGLPQKYADMGLILSKWETSEWDWIKRQQKWVGKHKWKYPVRIPDSTMVTVKMAPVLVPKIFSELCTIKKLPFKLLSCFWGMSWRINGVVLFQLVIRAFLYCLAWAMFYSCFPCSWFFVSWKWLLCMMTWTATASPTCEAETTGWFPLTSSWVPTEEISTARAQQAALTP